MVSVLKIFGGQTFWAPFCVRCFTAIEKARSANRTSENQLISIAGGGDTVSALKTSASISKFSYVSTAGGAFLEWLEGKTLPGIESLK